MTHDRVPHTETLDGAEPATAIALLPLYNATEVTASDPPATAAQLAWYLRPPYLGEVVSHVVRSDEGEIIGHCTLVMPRHDNRNLCYGRLGVHPAHRRRGIGSVLHARGLATARADERTRMVMEARDTASAREFAGVVSARRVFTEQRSRLEVASVDRARLARLSAETGQPNGYRLVRWNDHCPDELIGTFLHVMAAMNDAPQGGLDLERHSPAIAELRFRERQSVEYGVRRYVVAAVDEATGEAVGYSAMHCFDAAMADQGDTAVVHRHRGRRLGMWLKCALLEWVLDEEPHVSVIETWNGVSNEHMLAINRALGWLPAEAWSSFQSEIAGRVA